MNKRFDVIVVGVGAMGSAICDHLAGRGVKVLGLEQFDIPHARGSSHGYSRAGFVRPESAIAAHAELAMHRGAQLHGHGPIRRWMANGGSVTVHTDRAVYEADRLVFSGGAWSGKLFEEMKIPLTVTRPRRPGILSPRVDHERFHGIS